MASEKTLRLVLDKREKDEKAALERWGQANARVQAFAAQIEQIKEFRAGYVSEMTGRGTGGLSMQSYVTYQEFIDKLDHIAERQEHQLLLLRDEAERCRQEYVECMQQRKIIELLIDKQKAARRAAADKAEQKLLDEIVTARTARELRTR